MVEMTRKLPKHSLFVELFKTIRGTSARLVVFVRDDEHEDCKSVLDIIEVDHLNSRKTAKKLCYFVPFESSEFDVYLGNDVYENPKPGKSLVSIISNRISAIESGMEIV